MKKRKHVLRSELLHMAFLVLLVFAARSSLADHYHVPSGSMEYTLVPGDRVVVDKTAYGVRIPFTKIDLFGAATPQAGDIAVFDSPESGILLIKRIVALGGDRVELVDGNLQVNEKPLALPGRPLLETYSDRIAELNLNDGGGPNLRGLQIPDGQVLALGDHRGNSRDGRYFGLIDERELYGRAVAVYYSRQEGFRWKRL